MRWLAAALLSLTVVVAGPATPASALDWKDLTKIEKLDLYGPKVQQGKGIVKFGLKASPWGRILSLGALAWGAYEAYDYMVNAPQPGGELGDWLGDQPAYPSSAFDNVMIAEVLGTKPGSPHVIQIRIKCQVWSPTSSPYDGPMATCGSPSNVNYYTVGVGGSTATTKLVECRLANGTIASRTLSSGTYPNRQSTDGEGDAPEWVTTETPFCSSGETVVGFAFNAGTQTTGGYSLHAPIGWGTLGGSDLPPGEVTFAGAVVQVKCKNAETGAVQLLTTRSDWGASETLTVPSCKQRLGEDWYGIGVKVIPMDPEIDDLPVDPEVWPDWDVPDFVPEEWEEEVVPEEEAEPCHGTKHGCPLSIEIDGEPVYPGSTTRTKIDTIRATDPSRVKCYLGQREVEWKLCIPLLPGFEPGAGTSTTIDPTKPETGTDVPTTGTGTQPVPTEVKSCMKAAFSWNPVDWVYVPVKCVLTWAFVPTQWPNWATITSPIPPGWIPQLPSISGGTCGVVNMPSLNLGPLLSGTPSGKLFDTCEWSAARNVTYYGTLALLLVVTGRRAFGAVMDALGMQIKGDLF